MTDREQITVGVIGTGWIVRAHVHALHTLNHLGPLPAQVRIKWLYGRRPEKIEPMARELGIERATTDLVGEPESVIAAAKPILSTADDTILAGFEMPGGATASLEASSCATGWKDHRRIEVNGTEGSAWWDMEDYNRLHVMFVAGRAASAAFATCS